MLNKMFINQFFALDPDLLNFSQIRIPYMRTGLCDVGTSEVLQLQRSLCSESWIPSCFTYNYTSQDSSAPAGVVAFESLVVEGLGEKGAGVSLRQENIPPFHSSFLYLLLFQILNTGIQYGTGI